MENSSTKYLPHLGKAAIGLALLCMVVIGFSYSLNYNGPDLYHERWLRSEVSAFGILVSVFLLLQLHGRAPRRVPGAVNAALLGGGLVTHWWWFTPTAGALVAEPHVVGQHRPFMGTPATTLGAKS